MVKCQKVTNEENTKKIIVGFKVTPYMNTQHKQYAQIIFQSEIEEQNKLVNKKDRDRRRRSRRRRYKRGKVYGGDVEEEEEDEEDEYEAYKAAREYDEPLKEPRKVGIATL